MDEETERLIVQMAKENPRWGYDRIAGALKNLGQKVSAQTVGNILRRHGLSPAPKRKQVIGWKDFIRAHMDVLVGTDFFTANGGQKAERRSPAMSGATGRPAQVLRERGGLE
jgi:putative transposase